MAVTHLLDTSVYSQPLRPKPIDAVRERWATLGDERLATSVICEAEMLYGLELKGSPRLWSAYESLLKGRFKLLPVDLATITIFASIKAAAKRRGRAASDFDFLIAATAKATGLIVVTLNARHFHPIDGLAVEDWSV